MRSQISLYQIADEYKQLLDNLYCEETGEINDLVMARLDKLERPLQDKCINVVRSMKSFSAEHAAIKVERQAMQAREKALSTRLGWLEDYLRDNMEKSQINEISCPQFVIKLQKNPESVEIYDEDMIPVEYDKVEIKKDVAKIKSHMKDGLEIPGARLVRTNRISIK